MNAYEDVLEWHLRENGSIADHEGLKEAGARKEFIGREALVEKLAKRYGLWDRKPVDRLVRLPSSKEVVRIPCRKAEDCMLQLLTDPRIKDEDYSFFNDDPLAPPPEEPSHIGDVNTCLLYTSPSPRD